MTGEYLVAEIFVRLPGDPDRAVPGDGERWVVVLAVGRAGDLLRSRRGMHHHIAVEELERTTAAQVAQVDVEGALRRRDAGGRRAWGVHGDGYAGGRRQRNLTGGGYRGGRVG